MESDWDKFSKVMNEKIDNKLFTIEQQLDYQQELIGGLSKTISKLVEVLQNKSGNNIDLKLLSKRSSDATSSKGKNLDESEEDKPGEITKDDSEEPKETLNQDPIN
jgi:hypothetical protein